HPNRYISQFAWQLWHSPRAIIRGASEAVKPFASLRIFAPLVDGATPIHRIAPAPRLLCLVSLRLAPRCGRSDDSVRRAKLGADLGLADAGMRQHTRADWGWAFARQRYIGELLVLIRQRRAFHSPVDAQAVEPLEKVAPVRVDDRAGAIVRA